MSVYVITDGKFELNGTDHSSFVQQVTLNIRSEMQDVTAFGDTTRKQKGGLLDYDFEVMAHQDYATLDRVMFAIVGTTACFEIRRSNTCSTAVNPIWSGVAVLESYAPISGPVGSVIPATYRFRPFSALSRASSS